MSQNKDSNVQECKLAAETCTKLSINYVRKRLQKLFYIKYMINIEKRKSFLYSKKIEFGKVTIVLPTTIKIQVMLLQKTFIVTFS